MIKTIDLNCDVGETDSQRDQRILPLVTSCNVSCGIHAGNPVLIASTIRTALNLGVAVGAHPSYPDRDNFGRQSMELPLHKLCEHVRYQISAIQGMVNSLGGKLNHIKPHGALYHDMVHNRQLASAVLKTIGQLAPTAAIYGQADSHLMELCARNQLTFVHEVFADRHYESNSKLRSRSQANCLLDNAKDFQRQLLNFLNGQVVDTQDCTHAITVQTICLHSDTPQAIEYAQQANQLFKEHHVRMAAP